MTAGERTAIELLDCLWGPALDRFDIERSDIARVTRLPIMRPLSRSTNTDHEFVTCAERQDRECEQALAQVNERFVVLAGGDFVPAGKYFQREIAARGGPVHAVAVLLTAGACGESPNSRLLSAATGLELLMCFPRLLLQVVDDGSSLERRINNTLAILLADFAVACSLRPLSELPVEMVSASADLACTMSEGAALALAPTPTPQAEYAQQVGVLERLAGRPLGLAARMGAELAGARAQTAAALEAFGYELGMSLALSGVTFDPLDSGGLPFGCDATRAAEHARRALRALDGAVDMERARLDALAGSAAELSSRVDSVASAA